MIASLKGLRNTRHLTDEVAQKVTRCALDKSAKSRVRVAAVEAFFAEAGKPVVSSMSLIQVNTEDFFQTLLKTGNINKLLIFKTQNSFLSLKKKYIFS